MATMNVMESSLKAAPELSLPDSAGRLVRLSDFSGHAVLVSFLSHAA